MEMSKEATEARKAYQKQWRMENPEKVKRYIRSYWERKAEKARLEAKGGKDEL